MFSKCLFCLCNTPQFLIVICFPNYQVLFNSWSFSTIFVWPQRNPDKWLTVALINIIRQLVTKLSANTYYKVVAPHHFLHLHTPYPKPLQILSFSSFSPYSLFYMTWDILATCFLGSWSSLGSLCPLCYCVPPLLLYWSCSLFFFLLWNHLFCCRFSVWTLPHASGCVLPHIYNKILLNHT